MTLTYVLREWDLDATAVSPAGGTAGRTWRVAAGGQAWFVRRRGARTATPERVAFDHGLRRWLAGNGFPAVAPARQATGDDGVYELYPWVDGEPLTPALAERCRPPVAHTLAWFHRLAAAYDAPCEPLLPQFGHYPEPPAPSPRFDDPRVLADAVAQVARLYGRREDSAALGRAERWVAWLAERYGAARYARLPQGVIHGDFNGCNLLFAANGAVAGVFDYDWAWRDTRVRDVGEALFFFGAQRERPLDGGDIWSLTACPRLALEPMREFLVAYQAALPLSPAELQAVPLAMLGRWVACRTEGVMKVPTERRVEFLLAEFERPFEWVAQHAERLLADVTG